MQGSPTISSDNTPVGCGMNISAQDLGDGGIPELDANFLKEGQSGREHVSQDSSSVATAGGR